MTALRHALCLAVLPLLAGCPGRFSPSGSGATNEAPAVGQPGARAGFGLTALAADEERIGLRWRRPGPEDAGFAIFVGPSEAAVYDGAPRLVDPPGDGAVLSAPPSSEVFVGLALDSPSGWQPAGPILTIRTAAVLHVDPSAPAGGDGLTPETPLNNLLEAVLIASVTGGGNVWSTAGHHAGFTITIPEGVDVFGGFDTDFDLGTRDPDQFQTWVSAPAGEDVLAIVDHETTTVIDGLFVDGLEAKNGIEIDSAPVEVRSVAIEGASRGFRIRAPLTATAPIEVDLVHCSVVAADLQGVSVEGAFQIAIDGCSFLGCGEEGVDLNDLVAPVGAKSSLLVRDSRFIGNSEEGLDCDLSAGDLFGGGEFEVDLSFSDFEHNGRSGALVDLEFEFAPEWLARVRVLGCRARRNGQHGLSLDLDARATVFVDRVACQANAAHGLSITSESQTGVAQVSGSLFQGNAGFGLRASSGNYATLAAHCVMSGNHAGGMSADIVESSAVSCVSYLQPNPWSGVLIHRSVTATAADLPVFLRAPVQILAVLSAEAGLLELQGTPEFGPGAPCELDGDEVPREAVAVSIGAGTVEVDPAPDALTLPATLSAFAADGGGVVEDHHLSPGSIAAGAGLPAPDGVPTDAGPLGAPFPAEPGAAAPPRLPFHLFRVSPPVGVPVGPDEVLVFEFVENVAPASLLRGVSVVDGVGSPVGASFLVVDGALTVGPPAEGWAGGELVRLHRGLRSTTSAGLASEAALRVVATP